MNLIEVTENRNVTGDIKMNAAYSQFRHLLEELNKKELTPPIIETINQDVLALNATQLIGNNLKKFVRKKQLKIVSLVEKELKIVPKNHYRNMWLALGMSAFGIPIGIAFGISIGNIALLGVGLPIGLAIGMGVGSKMDKKAFEEGRQLDIELK
ncbi:MAG: hypothetical protein ABI266_01105 [Ginsengibacter sp.]